MSAFQSERIISEEGYDITEAMTFTSIYIPNVPEDLMLNGCKVCSESDLKYLFEIQFPLGKVKRVDIATRPHRSGGHVRCAFVHFESWGSYATRLRMKLAAGGEYRLYGPTPFESFYSSNNRSFQRYITLKMNRAPIAEVSELEAEQMNIHQLVDNYKRLEKQLAEKDAKIAELEQLLEESRDREDVLSYENIALNNRYSANCEHLVDMGFELMAARCAAGDVGDSRGYWKEEPADGGPMTMDELTLISENV
jgi:hypothetical protein